MDAQQTSLFNAILIGGGIVVVIIIYFLISIISHQRRNMVLQKAKILAEITTLETERQRVSADLHDELGPVLASVKFKMYSIDINSDKDAVTMEKLTEEVDEIIVRLREIANNLVPNTLLRKGLVDALTESVDKYNGTNNLQITFTPCKVPSLPQSSAINIYRIVLEIIHNAIKHSQ
ncbi:MAG: sensor histidine kinase, partial [Bacteroidetes bacterium]|nr:sensor histidine kinase [Bacteroidota bacterium]